MLLVILLKVIYNISPASISIQVFVDLILNSPSPCKLLALRHISISAYFLSPVVLFSSLSPFFDSLTIVFSKSLELLVQLDL